MTRKIKYIILAAVAIIVIVFVSWFGLSNINNTPDLQEKEPADANLYATGSFQPGGYEVSGTASILETNDTYILRFNDFKTEDGPGLFVYLSTDLTATDYIDLGELKAIEGDFNYEIDTGIDFNKYKNVLIWCEPFNALFGYAELTI
jgi:hypothetical protein